MVKYNISEPIIPIGKNKLNIWECWNATKKWLHFDGARTSQTIIQILNKPHVIQTHLEEKTEAEC